MYTENSHVINPVKYRVATKEPDVCARDKATIRRQREENFFTDFAADASAFLKNLLRILLLMLQSF